MLNPLIVFVITLQTDPAADAPTLFICNSYGAHVIEPRCPANEDTCRRSNDQLHHLHLSNCHIECPEESEFSSESSIQTSPSPSNENITPSNAKDQGLSFIIFNLKIKHKVEKKMNLFKIWDAEFLELLLNLVRFLMRKYF